MDLSTIAYNIHYGKKLDLIQNWLLSKKHLDIICLQEFPFKKDSAFLKLFEQKGYGFAYAPSFTRKKTQYGELTLFDKKKIKLLQSKALPLGTNLLEGRWIEKGFIKQKGQRSSLLTLFEYKGKKLVVANSHLLCFALNSHRLNQLNKILTQVHKIGDHTKYASVILGDFNYTSIIRQKKLIEFMAKNDHNNAYKTHTHKLFTVGQQLDYVFYNGCAIKKVVIEKSKLSDHYPVQFSISL
jgi:endonuclease/exonuclease/phosphatase family metal-dependent hydrolase